MTSHDARTDWSMLLCSIFLILFGASPREAPDKQGGQHEKMMFNT